MYTDAGILDVSKLDAGGGMQSFFESNNRPQYMLTITAFQYQIVAFLQTSHTTQPETLKQRNTAKVPVPFSMELGAEVVPVVAPVWPHRP